MTKFEDLLERYIELIVRVGLNIRAGQKLWIGAPISTAPLVERLAASAYRAGARLVDVNWVDDQLSLIRLQNAPRDSFEEYPHWRVRGREEYIRDGNAILSIYAADPDLLKGQDTELISTMMQTANHANRTVSDMISKDLVNWCVVSIPVPSWAKRVFPGENEEQAVQKLWEAILRVTRADQPDPVAAWQEHIDGLFHRAGYMNEKQYAALRFRGPGTDLTVGLPEGHFWMGGRSRAANGIEFTPNMPTEEIFTMPHKDRVNGVVANSRPLHHAGMLIENFSFTFKDGRVTSCSAETGEAVLKNMLKTDAGAERLGEVALVPNSSPVAQTGLLFLNMLYDENAASHLALGNAYPGCLEGGESLSGDELTAKGANISVEHTDFMIGSAQMDVDGLTVGGNSEPLMRSGEWTF